MFAGPGGTAARDQVIRMRKEPFGAESERPVDGRSPTRSRRLTSASVVVIAVSLTLLFSGCAGGSGRGTVHGGDGEVVASVEGRPISHATLRHWMLAMTGGDFYEVSGRQAPLGLVSEPADDASCVADLGTLTKRAGTSGHLTATQLSSKCRKLHEAIKQQALGFLISSQLKIGEASTRGVGVTDRDVAREFGSLRAERFPTDEALARYLQERRWTVSDERYLVKLNLISAGLQRKLQGQLRQMGRAALVKLSAETMKKWSAKTTCRPGYVVRQCKEYRGSVGEVGQSPAVLIEEIVRTK
jgi:hypothetical protein